MKRILSLVLVLCLLLGAAPFASALEGPTEAEAYEAMIALKSRYPTGYPWDNSEYYNWNGGIYTGGYGCVAFAFMLSDAAFGALPARIIETVEFDDVRVGDILRMNNDTHSVIVLETHEDTVVLAEGSYNDSVHWGRILSEEEVEGADYLMTRYPDDSTGGDDSPSDCIIPPDAVIISSGNCGENDQPNVKWTLCEDGTLYFTGFGPTYQYTHGYTGWYDNRDMVKKVVFQDGITNIGSRTFWYNTALTEVILPDSITEIGIEAFYGCSALADISLPAALTRIDSRAFYGCSALSALEFPDTLETINIFAFNNSGLTEAILPEGLTYLGTNSFEDCTSLKKIHVPGTIENNIQYLCQGCTALEDVSFGEGLTAIGRYCFRGCESLEEVSFPASMVDIGEYAFAETSLTELVLPAKLQELGDHAFRTCPKLESVSIPGTITTIGNYVFTDCASLRDVTIAEGLTDLGGATFHSCAVLGSITLPSSLTRIGAYAFSNAGLTCLEIPAGVTEIGAFAFEQMPNLQVLTLPSTLTWVGQRAADNCERLPLIYFNGTQAQYNAIEFQSDDTLDYWYDIVFVDQGSCSHRSTKTLRAVGSTCEDFGMTAGTICADCGKVLKAPELITELAHRWSDWVALDEYTECRTCSYCYEIEYREIPKAEHPFTDVPEGKFYYEPVLWAVEQGITSGTTATTFSPDDTCTRGHVVTFLWRAAGKPEPMRTTHPFTDVKESAFYYKAMLWAVENGITSGTSSTTFAPDDPCTRGQVVTFLHRAKNKPAPTSTKHPFTDVEAGKFYYTAMLWAVENNITAGTGANTFAPDDPCTRGQVVTFLYRCYKDA